MRVVRGFACTPLRGYDLNNMWEHVSYMFVGGGGWPTM